MISARICLSFIDSSVDELYYIAILLVKIIPPALL